jgi:integrase
MTTRTTVGELVNDLLGWYRTVSGNNRMANETQARWTNHLSDVFAAVPCTALTTALQRKYRSKRKNEGASNTTIDTELQVIRRSYKLASQSEPPKVSRVPKFELVREENARKVFMDSATTEKLKAAAHRLGLWQGCLIEMAFTYGWRRNEYLRLRAKDVDLVDGTLRLGKTKNGEAREVPLTKQIQHMLELLVAETPKDSPLFPARSDFYEWELICREAGVPHGEKTGFIFHDIRRSSARNKRAAGIDTSLIMHMQGWKTEKMFRRYAIVDRSDLSRALAQEADFARGA